MITVKRALALLTAAFVPMLERKELTMTTELTRGALLRKGVAATAVGAAVLALPDLARADDESPQIGEIYQLQAAFHRAKTTQDLDLMMSLWADDATFTNDTTGVTYVGAAQIRSFWAGSGSFTHHRFSLVPSYKTTIQVKGDQAFLYFECHDIGNFATGDFDDPTVKTIVDDTFLAGTLHHVAGNWLSWNMTAGPSSPLSYTTYYYPIP
jgi:ketosteroid isomerase-like protein